MPTRITTRIVVLIAVLAATGCHASKPHESLLFVQTAESARITPVSERDRTYTLELENVADHATYFTDRPYRKTGQVSVRGMVDKWDHGKDSFEADPPNAAVSIAGSDRIWVLALSKPELHGSTLRYSVKLLHDTPHFAPTNAGDVPRTAERVTLFIDNLWYSGGNPDGNPGMDPMNRPANF